MESLQPVWVIAPYFYLACKKWEFLFAECKKLVEVFETLEAEKTKYKAYCEPRIDIAYMKHWRNVLRN